MSVLKPHNIQSHVISDDVGSLPPPGEDVIHYLKMACISSMLYIIIPQLIHIYWLTNIFQIFQPNFWNFQGLFLEFVKTSSVICLTFFSNYYKQLLKFFNIFCKTRSEIFIKLLETISDILFHIFKLSAIISKWYN